MSCPSLLSSIDLCLSYCPRDGIDYPTLPIHLEYSTRQYRVVHSLRFSIQFISNTIPLISTKLRSVSATCTYQPSFLIHHIFLLIFSAQTQDVAEQTQHHNPEDVKSCHLRNHTRSTSIGRLLSLKQPPASIQPARCLRDNH